MEFIYELTRDEYDALYKKRNKKTVHKPIDDFVSAFVRSDAKHVKVQYDEDDHRNLATRRNQLQSSLKRVGARGVKATARGEVLYLIKTNKKK